MAMSKPIFGVAMPKLKWTKNGSRARIIIFLVVCGVFLLVHNNTNVSQSTKHSNADKSSRLYTSVKHGFSVNFPGEPSVQNSSLLFKQAGRDIRVPFTIYKGDDGQALYTVIVYEYSSEFNMSDIDARLKGALNGSIQNFKSARIVNSKFSQFAGHRSINGAISVDSGGETHSISVIAFLKDNTLYLLQTVDTYQINFNGFVNSFQLNQK